MENELLGNTAEVTTVYPIIQNYLESRRADRSDTGSSAIGEKAKQRTPNDCFDFPSQFLLDLVSAQSDDATSVY